MAGDNCLLMAAYCKNIEEKNFWYGLSDLWDKEKDFYFESVEVFGYEKEPAFWDDEIDDIDLDNILYR